MKHTITILLVLVSTITFSQENSLVGVKTVGANFVGGFGGLSGYRPGYEVSFGKYLSNKLQVGLNARVSYFSSARYERLYSNNSQFPTQTPPNTFTIRQYQLNLNAYAKYYFTQSRFRPFVYAEMGPQYFNQTIKFLPDGTQDDLNAIKAFNFHAAAGVGLSAYINKKRNFEIQSLFLVENPKTIVRNESPSFEYKIPARVNFRIGVNYYFGSKK